MDATIKQLILETAEEILKENSSLTTLDLKNELIQRYPDQMWYQEDVSYTLMEAELGTGLGGKPITFHDTQRYRVYVFKQGPQKGTKKLVTKTKLASLVLENEGEEITVKFKKGDGSVRTMIGIPNGQNALGYIHFEEENVGQRLVDPRTLERVEVAGQIYVLK